MIPFHRPRPVCVPSFHHELMIDLRVLGTLSVQPLNGGGPVAGVTQPKRLALLLYLALAEPSGPHSRESLMALLWPEGDDESTRHSLRNTLYGLRQALGEGAILPRGEGYVELDPAAIRCDAVEVRGLLAAQRWKDALAAWGGDLAPGFHISGAPRVRALARRSAGDPPPCGGGRRMAAGGRDGAERGGRHRRGRPPGLGHRPHQRGRREAAHAAAGCHDRPRRRPQSVR